MSGQPRIRRVGSFLAVAAANCIPLVGVTALGWNVVAVLALYWVEMGVTALWSIPRILLAEPRDTAGSGFRLPFRELRKKRGGRPLWPGGPTAYVRNVPVALQQVGFAALFWVGLGLLFAGVTDLPRALTPAVLPTVAVGALAAVVAHGIEFTRDYVGDREYVETTDRAATVTTARQGLFFFLLVALVAGSEGFREAGVTAVALVVAAKLCVEAYDRFVADGTGPLARLADRIGSAEAPAPVPDVPLPDGDPDAVVRPDRRAVLVGCALRGFLVLLTRFGLLVAVATAFFGLFVSPLLGIAGVLLGVAGVLLGAAVHYSLYGTVEYRRYGAVLVGYDGLLGVPQWRAPLDAVDATVRRRLTDRYLGTATAAIDWRETDESPWTPVAYEAERTNATVGPVPSFERLRDDLRLPVVPADRPTPNRTVAVAAGGLALVFLALPVAVAAATGRLAVLAVVPALGIILLALCWVALFNA